MGRVGELMGTFERNEEKIGMRIATTYNMKSRSRANV
jgi:hypothetical protein